MAASSFGATNIRVEMDAGTGAAPTWERQAYLSTRHVPASDGDVTQVTGLGNSTLSANLFLSSSEWTALQAQLLVQATLTLAGVSQGTCLLEALGTPVRYQTGHVSVGATFRKVSG